MEYNRHWLRTPNNLHSPSATAVKVTAVLSSNHIYLLRTVLYWLKPPYTMARVSVTNVKLCHDLPSGLSWNGCFKLSNKQTGTHRLDWDLISDTVLLGQRFLVFWRTVAPSSSSVKQILRLLDRGGSNATTLHHITQDLNLPQQHTAVRKSTYTPTLSLLPPYMHLSNSGVIQTQHS